MFEGAWDLRFNCGEKKVYYSIKKSQNIMSIIVVAYGKWLNDVLIHKRQVLYKFFDNIEIFRQRFATPISF